ncbi:PucR family transcriptional regulator [Anaerocolumna xylanovorans]|uniref:PucR C-terminal helix-turn-helix domain-containing protein n=1 Tax=Anaerocolumna xylanovorans DSM 12503 TaxID=1121345 RepID=A0A1M7YA97_9FIRM|nr:PucR family transcriptional regulator [Anaerocolumna xylanovorans]SHO49458.1 PucR C-terminal helix-turn-helix domain-containing protein [Anaerocolumna xylanovorans DSM 12503]
MAIAVSKLYRNCASLYQMQLLAGHKGLGNLVEWVHIVEDQEVSSFLHGHELIFIAGYMYRDDGWLLNFTKELYKSGTSAFVINLGPYIKSVPKEVVDFCNEVDMPLFTIPWKIRLVDVTRDFCTRIMHNESVEASVASTIKDIIFKVGDIETQIQHMERNGYKRDCHLCFVNMSIHSVDEQYNSENMEKLRLFVEQIARTSQRMFISFTYQANLVVVLSESDMYNVRKFVEELMNLIRKKKDSFSINMGVSSIMQGLMNQDINFEKAIAANEMAEKRKVRVTYYDELDIYKVLLAVKDKKVLKEFYHEVFGRLEQYDAENGTDLMGFLRSYLDNNGSPQLVSEQQFIHRNTVNNQLKKIEKITGYNLLNLEEKVRCSIGYMIQDLIT